MNVAVLAFLIMNGNRNLWYGKEGIADVGL